VPISAQAQARRRKVPGVRDGERARARARTAALRKLSERYPDEFRKLYVKECKAAGVQLRRPGRPVRNAA